MYSVGEVDTPDGMAGITLFNLEPHDAERGQHGSFVSQPDVSTPADTYKNTGPWPCWNIVDTRNIRGLAISLHSTFRSLLKTVSDCNYIHMRIAGRYVNRRHGYVYIWAWYVYLCVSSLSLLWVTGGFLAIYPSHFLTLMKMNAHSWVLRFGPEIDLKLPNIARERWYAIVPLHYCTLWGYSALRNCRHKWYEIRCGGSTGLCCW